MKANQRILSNVKLWDVTHYSDAIWFQHDNQYSNDWKILQEDFDIVRMKNKL